MCMRHITGRRNFAGIDARTWINKWHDDNGREVDKAEVAVRETWKNGVG